MTHTAPMISNNILNELKTCTQLQYNGCLKVRSSKGHQWTFFYRLGRIVWAQGGSHPFRRWRRNMAQYCPQIDTYQLYLQRREDVKINQCDYRILELLYKKQLIRREQIHAIIENTIAELLFDLAQKTSLISARCDRTQEVIIEIPVSFTSADVFMKKMQDSWKFWSGAGLANFSPDLAPIIRKPEQLQQQVSESVYKKFVNLLNGQYTLLDLAANMKQSIVPLTRSLLPYINRGIIELIEVPDLPLSLAAVQKSTAPLVACIDDSPQVCETLEKIIVPNGVRFIKIQDSIQALPILIQHKPDLIFLDLVMPIANGYEICSQIRRVSALSKTPVVILTGNDGLVDRVRSKVVGATDFMAKPVSADKIMGVIGKYLPLETQNQVKKKLRELDVNKPTIIWNN
ncbi:response regulator [Nodularia chucula]|uniref:response regulator n=1 Tax=Nodularia chucula TaxID=3093667 RepID=UPI0039C60DC1